MRLSTPSVPAKATPKSLNGSNALGRVIAARAPRGGDMLLFIRGARFARFASSGMRRADLISTIRPVHGLITLDEEAESKLAIILGSGACTDYGNDMRGAADARRSTHDGPSAMMTFV